MAVIGYKGGETTLCVQKTAYHLSGDWYKGTVTTKCEEKGVYYLSGGGWVEEESDHSA